MMFSLAPGHWEWSEADFISILPVFPLTFKDLR